VQDIALTRSLSFASPPPAFFWFGHTHILDRR